MTATDERTLPFNLEAERSILGAVLVSPRGRVLDEVSDRLTDREFYREAHRRIYRSMLELHKRGSAVDHVTLKNELARVGDLDEVGGPAYIASLGDGVPGATNVLYYLAIVREKSAKRDVIDLANRLLAQAYADEDDPGTLVDAAERGLLELSSRVVPGDLVPASQIVRNVAPVLERLHERHQPVTGLASGFAALDRYTRGFQAGNLVIIGGRTSQGKSTIVAQIALHVAQTVPVAFFSVEMSEQEHAFRTIATLARVDGHLLQCGQLGEWGQKSVGLALQDFADLKFWLDESSTISALQIRSRARRLKAKHGLGLIVVDYLQLLQHPRNDRNENNEQRVAATGRMLKAVARELGVPVIALCQLSRQVENRQDGRPRLADLRESGSLEQDADLVLLIYRPQPKDHGGMTETPATELIVAKSRNGPTASVELRWLGEQYRFEEIA